MKEGVKEVLLEYRWKTHGNTLLSLFHPGPLATACLVLATNGVRPGVKEVKEGFSVDKCCCFRNLECPWRGEGTRERGERC